MKLHENPHHVPSELRTGGSITVDVSAINISFPDMRYAISTSPLNGGLHHVLALRNQQLTFFIETEADLPGGSTAKYLAMECQALDQPINFCTALLTSATMERHAYAYEEQDGVIVEAIATAGYEATAHRAGDGALYKEKDLQFHPLGTINLFIFTNQALTDGAMVKSLITITEAKTVALAEEGIKSVVTGNLATGTSTDGVIFTIDMNGPIITDVGTFSLFGDLLAKAVRSVLKKAFANG